MRKIRFTKMHGAGNDFVMVDDRDGGFPATKEFIAKFANRPDGIGCEGVILVQNSATADFKMRFFNPDGTEADLCGNGARCVAAFAKAIGAVRGDSMRFETAAGEVKAEIAREGLVKIWMPGIREVREDFAVAGVPHRIVPVEDLAEVDVDGEGRRIRWSAEFAPAGTNVDFVTYAPPDRVAIRTYERGVEAESGACGTGSVASAAIGVAQHGLKFPVTVRTVGGYELVIDGRWDGVEFSEITLTGPVKTVFAGEINQ